jgi:hypothetical protein
MQSRRVAARPGSARPRWSNPRLVLAAVSLAGLLAACSGAAGASNGVVTLASATPGGSADPSPSSDPETAMLNYAQCMRDHGVDMPDPVFSHDGSGGGTVTQEGPNGNPKDNPGFQAAQQACQHFLDDVRKEGGGKQLSADEQKAFLDFAACMRDHGVDMPDPDFSGGGVSIQVGGPSGGGGGGDGGARIDPQSPAFQAAQTACQHFLGDAGMGKFGTGGGPAGGPAASASPAPATSEPTQ